MKKLLLLLVLFSLYSLGLFSQEMTGISGSSSVSPLYPGTYRLFFDSPLAETTTITIVSNYGKINGKNSSTMTDVTVYSGSTSYNFEVYWPETNATDGYIIAYKKGQVGKTVELKGIKINKDGTTDGSSSNTSKDKMPESYSCPQNVYAGDIFTLGYKNKGIPFKIIDYSYDASLFEIVSKTDEVITFRAKQLLGTMRGQISIEIKTTMGFALYYYLRKTTWGFPVTGSPYIVAINNTVCTGNDVLYKIENLEGSATWEAKTNLSLVNTDAIGWRATFKPLGNGTSTAKATVKHPNGKIYSLENSSVWVGAPQFKATLNYPGTALPRKDSYYVPYLASYGVSADMNGATSYKWYDMPRVVTYSSPDHAGISSTDDVASFYVIGTNQCGTLRRNFKIYASQTEFQPNLRSLSEDVIEEPSTASIRIYSLTTGSVVYTEKNIMNFNIENTGLKKGIYVLEKTDGEGNVTRIKVAKQ
ncbi:T9SS type A sorting domain-containing protein [Dysgonomonas sp. ZJ709]|uniref:T9SS type A sorting domain-containing protein n=1 Tax=Dysgonomonas sp. ZJ709 TaxID=2709797 RepID=UPI0013ED564D|nr:T9SS type A sorting domain-containing protein [Dysgonomonas sp. ZJ709]